LISRDEPNFAYWHIAIVVVDLKKRKTQSQRGGFPLVKFERSDTTVARVEEVCGRGLAPSFLSGLDPSLSEWHSQLALPISTRAAGK